MSQDKVNAYKEHQHNGESVREIEAHALLSCASRLEEARQPGTPKDIFSQALLHNQKLWTLFQACLCDSENPLPRDLKTLLLNLSCYVDKVTFRALGERNPDLLKSLIHINRTIAAGLRQNPEAQAQQQPMQSTVAPPDPSTHTPIATSI